MQSLETKSGLVHDQGHVRNTVVIIGDRAEAHRVQTGGESPKTELSVRSVKPQIYDPHACMHTFSTWTTYNTARC